jgi:hypothetical protein
MKFEKCFKVNGDPPIEVYETHINFFGSNIDPKMFDEVIGTMKGELNYLKEAVKIWEKEFKK